MTDAVSVRPGRPEDHAAMCAILDATDAVHRQGAPWLFREPDVPARPPESFADFFRGETCAVFVAETDRVIGVAQVLLRFPPRMALFHQQAYGVLDALAVDAAFRRRGVGRMLAANAVDWVEARGGAWIELNVYEFNRDAMEAYEALGFETVSRKMRKALRP